MKTFIAILKDDRGATAVEMGLLCALIVLALLGALNGFAGEAISMWDTIADKTREASNPGN
ncbi:MAG: hypothetical protein RL268_2656 [Pseudomonadota bacterium]|jgi:pilus assembly protein Flp/PilA